jgi:hypothetical protein
VAKGSAGGRSGGKGRAASGGRATGSGGLAEGLKFDKDPNARDARYSLVEVDVSKLNDSWKKDDSFYIPRGGGGKSGKPGAYKNAKEFIRKQKAAGNPVHAPRVSVDRKGNVSIGDGRHRTAVLRDGGAKKIHVTVTRGQAKRVRKLFGP